MLRRTASPSALSFTRAMNFLATWKSTSASSNASRTWRSAASMFASLIVPWPRRSLKISCSLSPSCENIRYQQRAQKARLLLRCRSRSWRCGGAGLVNSERPMRFDFFVAGFRRQNHGAVFVTQFLRYLIRNHAGLWIERCRNNSKPADSQLQTGGIDLPDRAQGGFGQWQSGPDGCAVGRCGLQILRAYDRNCGRAGTAARSRDHFHRVFENFRLVRFDCITTERIHGRGGGNRLAVNSEHRFVACIARDFFHVLVVSAKRHSEAVDLDAEPLFEQLLAADDFILNPLLVLCPGQFLFGPFSAGFHYHDGMAFA